MSMAAEAARESHRNKATGEFQAQFHPEAPISLTPAAAAARNRRDALEAAAIERDREFQAARKAMNESRLEIAALDLQETGMNPGRVVIDGDEKYWYVTEAYDVDGNRLHDNQMIQIQDAMKDAHVQYDMHYRGEGVDLSALGKEEGPGDESPSGYVGRLASSVDDALKAAGVDVEEPQIMARDLLTNVRHWADANGVDMDEAMRGSYGVYIEERMAARQHTEEESAA